MIYTQTDALNSFKQWFLVTILWQCGLGLLLGIILGKTANRTLRFADKHDYVGRSSFVVFYLLMAVMCVGVGSTLGVDDFLVAFAAGVGFGHDGWFSDKTQTANLPETVDLLLNTTMFLYFGSDIPWSHFTPREITPHLGVWQLCVFLLLVLLFRRIPIVLAMKRWIPDTRTYREALFCGHFGPMGVGALFLAIEARAQLERGTSLPLPRPPPHHSKPYSEAAIAIETIWPVICFVVLGSTMVHGLSVAVITVSGHFSRHKRDRALMIGGETDNLDGMEHEGGGGSSEPSDSDDEEVGRVAL